MKVTPKDIKEERRMCSEFYSRTISMKISHYVSSFCINNHISANAVTSMMLISGLFSAILLLQDSIILQIIGAMSLFIVNIFDTADGEVARFNKKTSIIGIYYDKVFQVIVDILIFLVILYNQYRYFDDFLYTIPLIIIILFYFVDNYSKEVFSFLKEGNNIENAKETKLQISFNQKSKLQFFAHITSSNTAFFHLYWIFLLLDVVFFENFILQFLYLLYYMFLEIIRVINRQKKIIKNLGNTNENM